MTMQRRISLVLSDVDGNTARLTTDSFADEGFAKAIERFILGDAP